VASEIDPETVCRQAVGGSSSDGLTACLLHYDPASY
jgi:hypothetical protein